VPWSVCRKPKDLFVGSLNGCSTDRRRVAQGSEDEAGLAATTSPQGLLFSVGA
jgi:hypothetical protein